MWLSKLCTSSHGGSLFSPAAAQAVPADTRHAPLVLDCSFRMIHVWLALRLSSDVIQEHTGVRKASWEMLQGQGREVFSGTQMLPSWVAF